MMNYDSAVVPWFGCTGVSVTIAVGIFLSWEAFSVGFSHWNLCFRFCLEWRRSVGLYMDLSLLWNFWCEVLFCRRSFATTLVWNGFWERKVIVWGRLRSTWELAFLGERALELVHPFFFLLIPWRNKTAWMIFCLNLLFFLSVQLKSNLAFVFWISLFFFELAVKVNISLKSVY